MGIGGNRRGKAPAGPVIAGAGAFPAETFALFFADGKVLHLLCRFAPLVMSLNEDCFASVFSFLVLLLNSVSCMGQKNQYVDSLKVNHSVPCGIRINSLNHTFFTSLDSHFKHTLQPSDRGQNTAIPKWVCTDQERPTLRYFLYWSLSYAS